MFKSSTIESELKSAGLRQRTKPLGTYGYKRHSDVMMMIYGGGNDPGLAGSSGFRSLLDCTEDHHRKRRKKDMKI